MDNVRTAQVTTGISRHRGDIGVLCACGEPYEADHMPERGYVAMHPTCDADCSNITVVGTGTKISVKPPREADDGGED